jgi:beta-lactamase class D
LEIKKQLFEMKFRYLIVLFCFLSISPKVSGQVDLQQSFRECSIKGSTTIYDYKNQYWIYSDSLDAPKLSLPASTFKIINLLIALEIKVIKDENEVIKWVGKTDTTLYGYRPEIYKDMTLREAFEVSAGWVFIELAKKIGKKNYTKYLNACRYGNLDLSMKDVDFWNFGSFGISPQNQVMFLKAVYEEKLPFSKRNYEILKRVMVVEKTNDYTIRAKTGWTRDGGIDSGWWVGYV